MQPIFPLIYASLEELAEQNPALPPIAHAPGSQLFGGDGALDSLSLVSLIVLVTERVQDRYDVPLVLVDEKAFSSGRSPFRSIASLAEYVAARLREQGADV